MIAHTHTPPFVFSFILVSFSSLLNSLFVGKLKIRSHKEEEMADNSDNKKQLIDQACRTAKEFLDHYYMKVDSKRHTVAKTYLETFH